MISLASRFTVVCKFAADRGASEGSVRDATNTSRSTPNLTNGIRVHSRPLYVMASLRSVQCRVSSHPEGEGHLLVDVDVDSYPRVSLGLFRA